MLSGMLQQLIVGKGNKLKRFWLTDGFRDVLKNRIVCNVDAFRVVHIYQESFLGMGCVQSEVCAWVGLPKLSGSL